MAAHDTAHEDTLAKVAGARAVAPAAEAHHDHGHHHDDHDHPHAFEWPEAVRIAFVAVTAAAVWFKAWEPVASVSVIGVVGLLIGGWPIFKEAFENIIERRMTMELSMTVAIIAAAAIGEFFTALVITLFVLVAEVLEGLTVGRGRKAIRDLWNSCRANSRCVAQDRSVRFRRRRCQSATPFSLRRAVAFR